MDAEDIQGFWTRFEAIINIIVLVHLLLKRLESELIAETQNLHLLTNSQQASRFSEFCWLPAWQKAEQQEIAWKIEWVNFPKFIFIV